MSLRSSGGPMPPVNLRCEYRADPLGIDALAPRFSWEVNDSRRGALQTAYRIMIEDDSGLVWDSGKVDSGQCNQVRYEGPALKSAQRYRWRARTWDDTGKASALSEPASFEMGLLSPADWTASWISAPEPPSPKVVQLGDWIGIRGSSERREAFFRSEFAVPEDSEVDEAVIHVCADIAFILYVNGEQVGANYGLIRVEYDLTQYLRQGRNTVAVEVRRHRATGALAAGIRVRLVDGREIELLTDDSWLCAAQASADWRAYDCDDSTWTRCEKVACYGSDPYGTLPVKLGDPQPAPMFRKSFALDRPVKTARVYICGLGYQELYLNGERVGDAVLDPAQSDYQKLCYYRVYDVTGHLREGENAVGVILGGGFFDQKMVWGGFSYGEPALICLIKVDYSDGAGEFIATDRTWRSAPSHILMNNVYVGETCDGRLEVPGWADVAFDDHGWSAVRVVSSPTQELRAQSIPPIRRMRVLQPTALTSPAEGVWVYDLGQNFAGWPRLKIRAPRGTRVTMRCAETLDQNGLLDHTTAGIYHTHWPQTETYICKGEGLEVYEPRFTYHGFRYVGFTGATETPTLDMIEGVVAHTSVEKAGRFECSNSMLNRIHETALWTEISNLHSVPTDCPAREKCGWLGDAHVSAEMTILNYDMGPFWTKYLEDIRTTLNADDLPAMIAPGKRLCGEASIDWGTAMVQLPWYLYLYYGDKQILEAWYPRWRVWMDHCAKLAGDDLVVEGEGHVYGLGDWCPPGGNEKMETPVPLTSTAYYYYDAKIASDAARVLGLDREADNYADLAERIKAAFVERFYDASMHTFGSQTADSIALFMGLLPAGDEPAVIKSLVRDIKEKHGGHFSVGIMGNRFIYGELTRGGRDDVAFSLLTNETWPSIGFTFTLGATTLWEVFGISASPDAEKYYSLNHPMQGGFDEWFYSGVLGINPDPDASGFKRIIFRPGLVMELDWAKGEYRSIRGPIRSAWERKKGSFRWKITVPANSSARVFVPTSNSDSVTESGVPASESPQVTFVERTDRFAVYDVPSGEYTFRSVL